MKLVVALALVGACSHQVPAPKPGAPAAACVEPLADTRARLVADDPFLEAGDLALAELPYDLDGDGANEHAVEVVGWRGATGNRTVYLYASNHGCGRFASLLFGKSINPLETTHHGLRDVATFADQGCASMEGDYDVFVFDGQRYERDASRRISCACPETSAPDPTRDPQCPGYE